MRHSLVNIQSWNDGPGTSPTRSAIVRSDKAPMIEGCSSRNMGQANVHNSTQSRERRCICAIIAGDDPAERDQTSQEANRGAMILKVHDHSASQQATRGKIKCRKR